MRIPVGNFGNTQQTVIQQAPVDTSGSQMITRAAQNVGGAMQQLAAQQQQEREAMARAKAANALADHELSVKQAMLEVQRQEQNGEIKYQDSKRALQERIASIELPTIDGAPDELMTHFTGAIQRVNAEADLNMDAYTIKRQQDDFRGQFVQLLDTKSKEAGLPGADVEAINASAGAAAQSMARSAGLSEAETAKYVQDFKDRNWFNHATEKAISARNNLGALKDIENSLAAPDGFYQGKLDTEKRNALVSHVMSMRTQLENKIQIQADRADVKAQRAILEYERQQSTGVPATAAQLELWGKTTKGTTFEGEFNTRLKSEQVIQSVLRQPIDQQLTFVQKEQARLQQDGGSVQEVANLNRLANAVQTNVKQLEETPLLFAQARTGEMVQPLDIAQLVQPDGVEALKDQMADREATLGALKNQYGDQVQPRLLLPQEAKLLTSIMAKASPKDQAQIFSTLKALIPDPASYRGAMQQIAPDSPVKAMAGALMGYSGQQTLDTHWIGADTAITAQKAATTMLAGEQLINRTGADGKTDGKPSALPIPSDKDFSAEFQAEVGDAFAGRPQAFQIAMQAARAHYVGTMAESGDFSNELDTGRLRQSIKASLGKPVEYKNSKILLPWGMDESTFNDQVRVSLNTALHDRGLSTAQIKAEITKFPRMDLMNFGDGEYLVLDGARRPYIVNGQPVTVRVAP